MTAITQPLAKKQGMTRAEWRNIRMGLFFISPWILGISLWVIYPLLASLYYSFNRYDLLRPPVWIGLKNYTSIFTVDPNFWEVTWNTFYYVGIGAPLGVLSAFLMATLLNTDIRGRSIFRTIFFFPAIVPAVVTAMVWRQAIDYFDPYLGTG